MFKRGSGAKKFKNTQSAPLDINEELVYIVNAIGTNSYKIGKSSKKSLKGRLSSIKTGSPLQIQLIATINGGFEIESQIHTELSCFRDKGEWFKIEDYDVINKIIKKYNPESLAKIIKKPSIDDTEDSISKSDKSNEKIASTISEVVSIVNRELAQCKKKLSIESSFNYNVKGLFCERFRELSPLDKSIYIFLNTILKDSRLKTEDENLQKTSVGQREIARKVSCSTGAVSEALRRLDKIGLIIIEQAFAGARCVYHINDIREQSGEKNDSDSTNI